MGSSPLQERLTSRNITLICRARNSSQVSSSTLHLVQSAPWSGKVTTLLLPEERCSGPQDHSTLSQAPSVVTSASTWEETLSTARTLSNQQTRRSASGSRMRSSSTGNPTLTLGSMSELCRVVCLLRRQQSCEHSIVSDKGRLQHVGCK